ncbi:hypothetical protein NPIL_657791 [Nephila pilipes]|uniref:Uncharacterized protein n=1 Tax=Nephila pilipes TaxID=299642 RepID=A0A8X6I4G0_NEPPI|nr:hypothetical protein NPIL_657791 [Nephila pilipes]
MLSGKDKTLLVKLFYMTEESAAVALQQPNDFESALPAQQTRKGWAIWYCAIYHKPHQIEFEIALYNRNEIIVHHITVAFTNDSSIDKNGSGYSSGRYCASDRHTVDIASSRFQNVGILTANCSNFVC